MRVFDLVVRVLFFGLACCTDVYAYESDQYMNRTQKVSDALEIMDQQVNAAIDKVLDRDGLNVSRQAVARAIMMYCRDCAP